LFDNLSFLIVFFCFSVRSTIHILPYLVKICNRINEEKINKNQGEGRCRFAINYQNHIGDSGENTGERQKTGGTYRISIFGCRMKWEGDALSKKTGSE